MDIEVQRHSGRSDATVVMNFTVIETLYLEEKLCFVICAGRRQKEIRDYTIFIMA